jgi:site-specific recombinase XerD
MEAHIDAFIQWLGDVSDHTRKTYRKDIRQFLKWFQETYGQPAQIDDLAPVIIEAYKNDLMGRLRAKPATVKRRLATLRRLGQWALEQGYIRELPTKGVNVPPVPRTGPRSLEKTVVHRLLLEAQRDWHKLAKRNYAILRLLADTGIRVGAVVKLRLSDLTWTEGKRKASLNVLYGKGGRSNTIALPAKTRAALKEYLEVRPHVEDVHLFLSSRGGGMTPENVRQMVNKYASRAGIDPKEVSPHMFRHTLAKTLLAQGSPLPEVQAILGHAQISSTAIYTQPSEEEKADALEKASGEL